MKTTRTREDIINDIIEYFKENEDEFATAIEELDAYNGYLGDDRYYYMEDLNEFFRDADPIDILYRAYYGHDADSWIKDASGNREYGEFNPNRTYFYFNGYGNLVSADYKDYSDMLDKYIIDEISENRTDIDTIDESEELSALFDELESAEE